MFLYILHLPHLLVGAWQCHLYYPKDHMPSMWRMLWAHWLLFFPFSLIETIGKISFSMLWVQGSFLSFFLSNSKRQINKQVVRQSSEQCESFRTQIKNQHSIDLLRETRRKDKMIIQRNSHIESRSGVVRTFMRRRKPRTRWFSHVRHIPTDAPVRRVERIN